MSRGVDEKCAKMRAWVAFGANLPSKTGEPAETLSVAVQDLRDMGVTVRRASRVFETPCFPVGAGPSYINFAIEVETALTPEALLALLHQVEARHGRVRKTRWAGRSIDLDLMIGKTVQEMCDALPDADKSEIKAQSGLEIPVN